MLLKEIFVVRLGGGHGVGGVSGYWGVSGELGVGVEGDSANNCTESMEVSEDRDDIGGVRVNDGITSLYVY